MRSDDHLEARSLVDASSVEGLSPEDQRRLNVHLSACAECARYAEVSRRAAAAIRGFAFDVDPAAVLQVSAAVRLEIDRLAERRRVRSGALAAVCLTIVGSLAAWHAASWWAAQENIPSAVWQPAFAVLWVVPSLLLDALLWFRGRAEGELQ